MPEIVSLGGFVFLLLIICIGYVFVENLGKKDYRFYNSLTKNSVFERGLHYTIWGFVINFLFLWLYYITGALHKLESLWDSAVDVARQLQVGSEIEISVFVFSSFYFTLLLIGACIISSIPRLFRLVNKKLLKTRK